MIERLHCNCVFSGLHVVYELFMLKCSYIIFPLLSSLFAHFCVFTSSIPSHYVMIIGTLGRCFLTLVRNKYTNIFSTAIASHF
jgi:hypothetical protein